MIASPSIRDRLLLAGLILSSWWGMQFVHEAGHAVAAWSTGGRVQRVELHPWTISRTDVEPNPSPLIVAWGGPILGVFLPLLAWITAAIANWEVRVLLRFFAGFCLVANGVYIGVGTPAGLGDAGDMLQHGSPPWLPMAFGVVSALGGMLLWHGQSRVMLVPLEDGRSTLWRSGVLIGTATAILPIVGYAISLGFEP